MRGMVALEMGIGLVNGEIKCSEAKKVHKMKEVER